MATLSTLGIVSSAGSDEIRITKDMIIEGDVTIDNDISCEDEMTVGGDITADEIKRPKWNVTKNIIVVIGDISTAGYTYFVVPFGGYIKKITSVITGAITVGDAVISLCAHPSGEVHRAYSQIIIATVASAGGDTDSMSLDYTNKEDKAIGTVKAGSLRSLHTDGGSTDTCIAYVTIEIAQDPW